MGSVRSSGLPPPGDRGRNNVRAFLMSRSTPLSAAADKSQSFRQAPHGVAVYRCLVHFGTPST
jgi:hypothetical protein